MGSNSRQTGAEILAKCRKRHGDRYSYPDGCDTRGGNSDTKIRIVCPDHGEFLQSARSHYAAGRKCPQCSALDRASKRAITGAELYKRFIEGGKAVHGGRYKYYKSDFDGKTARDKISITCPDHGSFEQTYNSHVKLGQGCRKCFIDRNFQPEAKQNRLDAVASKAERIAIFKKSVKRHHGNTYSYPRLNRELSKSSSMLTIVCPVCGPFKQPAYIHARGHGCRSCYRSTVERAIERYVRGLLPSTEVLTSDRRTIKPYELDIYIPDKKVAIEYGAVVWHAEDYKGSSYHATKQKRCHELGITLLTVFDVDWSDKTKRKIIKGRIKSALGVVDRSIYARKCSVSEISREQAKEFLTVNHLQGYRPAMIHVGLFENRTGELVSAASFGKPRFNGHYEWEVLRLSSKQGVSVVGGLSKVLAFFEKLVEPTSMISYADLRWGTGKSYESAGFKFSHRTAPARWYAHKSGTDGRLIHRMAVQRHKLPDLLGEGFNPSESATANLTKNGYVAVADCGNNVYIWKSKQGSHSTFH